VNHPFLTAFVSSVVQQCHESWLKAPKVCWVVLQESYSLLHKLEIVVTRDETERVDTLNYSWQNLRQQARETAARLSELEPHFRRQLTDDVTAFVSDCNNFCIDYQTVSRYDWSRDLPLTAVILFTVNTLTVC